MDTLSDIWHIVIFPEGATYCNGPLPDGTKGGLLAFEDIIDAQRLAEAIHGHTEERYLQYMKSRCKALGINLFLRRSNGRTQGFIFADSNNETTQRTSPVSPDERKAILAALPKP